MRKKLLDYALRVRLPIAVFVIIVSFATTYYVSRPERDGIGYAPEQPIKFSHKLHAGEMEIDCQYCHTSAAKTRHATVPPASTCMNCHTYAKKDSPEIQKLTEYYEKGEPIPWERIHKVPEYAYFNHSVHVNADIECQSCHGPVENMEVMKQVHSFTMGACLDCHRNPNERMPESKIEFAQGPENCNTCHR